ncbi:MAG: hypothetical protein R3B45_05115 [Bdellovibrionota bacterium]
MITLFSKIIKSDVWALDKPLGGVMDTLSRKRDWVGEYFSVATLEEDNDDSSIYYINARKVLFSEQEDAIKVQLDTCSFQNDTFIDSSEKRYLRSTELCQMTLFNDSQQKIAKIIDVLIDSRDWKLLYLVTTNIDKRRYPILVPLSLIKSIDIVNYKVCTILEVDILYRSPSFDPKKFAEWEHNILMQFYKFNTYS